MSKAVLISIKPEWCEKIANGEKTIEVRKTRPKIKTPFKCYIYCTYDGYNHLYAIERYMHGEPYFSIINHNKSSYVPSGFLNGKVIGEFICDEIMLAEYESLYGYIGFNTEWSPNDDCLTNTERLNYGFGKEFIYGWHISDLKIYDEPKELSEFGLKRPPQSWCYVEK